MQADLSSNPTIFSNFDLNEDPEEDLTMSSEASQQQPMGEQPLRNYVVTDTDNGRRYVFSDGDAARPAVVNLHSDDDTTDDEPDYLAFQERRLMKELHMRRRAAATFLQSAWRRRRIRWGIRAMLVSCRIIMEIKAAYCIQKLWKQHKKHKAYKLALAETLAKLREINRDLAAEQIQAAYRAHLEWVRSLPNQQQAALYAAPNSPGYGIGPMVTPPHSPRSPGFPLCEYPPPGSPMALNPEPLYSWSSPPRSPLVSTGDGRLITVAPGGVAYLSYPAIISPLALPPPAAQEDIDQYFEDESYARDLRFPTTPHVGVLGKREVAQLKDGMSQFFQPASECRRTRRRVAPVC